MNNTKKLRIVFTGPESTGKTTLAKWVAQYYRTTWNPEFARFYLSKLRVPYQKEDITSIAQGQIQWEDIWYKQSNKLLVCDTTLLVPKIWSLYKYGNCDHWIEKNLIQRKYDLFLLCGVDWPWQYDPLREHPNARKVLYQMYLDELKKNQLRYLELNGSFEQRKQLALQQIECLLSPI